ncbi:MAG: glycine dehydrogenase subunit 2 [Proteobacteria bacterium]|nr:glycine dehydrogenase subunit 2 [Pseudomonadota bacterium]
MQFAEPLIFEIGVPGRRGVAPPPDDTPEVSLSDLEQAGLTTASVPALPEVSELDLLRHFTRLSHLNFCIETHFYPLGSCTMKYNPKVNERVARLPGFAWLHPNQPEEDAQGALQLMAMLECALCGVAGMDRFTLQPAAGAHGEMTALLMVRAYFKKKGQPRNKVIIPDSAHGTNPSSARLAGFDVVTVKSDDRGNVDFDALDKVVDEHTACMMLTNPSTLGVFEENIVRISKRLREVGALLYYDGANLNALMGKARPGDMGFDLVHINLHKTFSTPHGGGGPGSGPVGARGELVDFLPSPLVTTEGGRAHLVDAPHTIGRVRSFNGNFGMLARAYAYIRAYGPDGLRKVSENAVLNANYVLAKVRGAYDLAFDRRAMHEFVLTGKRQKKQGVRALDIAKKLLDYGFHAPTVYFPLIVEEAIMIEPTETESRQTLDAFAEALVDIAHRAADSPESVVGAPRTLPVRRLDEVTAARNPVLKWAPTEGVTAPA